MDDDRVEGTVERVTYSNEESGWTVLRLLVPGRKDPLPVIGNLPGAQPGEWISAGGRFEYHPDYGEQFRAESYRSERRFVQRSDRIPAGRRRCTSQPELGLGRHAAVATADVDAHQ